MPPHGRGGESGRVWQGCHLAGVQQHAGTTPAREAVAAARRPGPQGTAALAAVRARGNAAADK